jgi:hypothetical protein
MMLRATNGVDTLGAADHTVEVTRTVIMRGAIGAETPQPTGHIANITTIIDMNKVIRTNPNSRTCRLTDGRRQTRLKLTAHNHDQRTPETLKLILVVVRNVTPTRPRRRRTRGVMVTKRSKSPLGKKVPLVV